MQLKTAKGGFTPHLFRELKKSEGFTLLETVIYIALLAILIGGGMVGVFNILEGSGRTRQAMYREQEAYFIIRKIDAVLSEATTVDTSVAGVLQTDDVRIDLGGEQIFLERGGGNAIPLNDTLVPATALNFDKNDASSTITTTFTLDNHQYSVSNYYYGD